MPKHQLGHSHAVTANRLTDGAVVYLREDGGWVDDLQHATIAHETAAAQGLMRKAEADMRDATVVGAYLIAVENSGGIWGPVALREQIRAQGLTFQSISADAVAWM